MVGWAAMGAAGTGIAASRSGHRSRIDRLGRVRCRLGRGRRRRAQHLSPRIENRLFTQRGLILFRSDSRPPREMMTDLPLRRNRRLAGLEPASPVTIEMIDPVLAVRRRPAWSRRTRLSDWSSGAGASSARAGVAASFGAGLNKSVKGFEDAGEVGIPAARIKAVTQKRQWPDMETPCCAPTRARRSNANWVAMRP